MKNEYKNIYKKEKLSKTEYCFICQKEIKKGNFCLSECNIFIDQKYNKYNEKHTPFFYICLNCIKTPEKAEEVIIPLLKIMYGYKIRVSRINFVTGRDKNFYY